MGLPRQSHCRSPCWELPGQTRPLCSATGVNNATGDTVRPGTVTSYHWHLWRAFTHIMAMYTALLCTQNWSHSSRVCLTGSQESSRAAAATPLHFKEAQGAARAQSSHVCMSKSTQEGSPKGKTTFLFTIHLCHLFCKWSDSQICSGNLPKLL